MNNVDKIAKEIVNAGIRKIVLKDMASKKDIHIRVYEHNIGKEVEIVVAG